MTQNSDLTKHYVIENLEFTHNTLVNNYSDIEIGYRDDWGRAPKNVLIANNLIVQNESPVTTVHDEGTEDDITFSNNIIHTSGSGSFGDLSFSLDEAINTDPMLEKSDCRIPGVNCTPVYANAIFKISSASSPAVDPEPAHTVSGITFDIEGQGMTGTRDIGADEFNSTDNITNGLLDARHVGPNAVSFAEGEVQEPLSVRDDILQLINAYPNPFERSITLESKVPSEVVIYSLDGSLIDSFYMRGPTKWSAPRPGLYFAHITIKGSKRVIKLLTY